MEAKRVVGSVVSPSFYKRKDVVALAHDLIGKYLFTEIDGVVTGGIITETEAYAGETDKASHAYGGRCTNRTATMYKEGGVAYVYLCYGIHSLFNIVTNEAGIPHAILIRGIEPTVGIEVMKERRGVKKAGADFCIGPGKVAKALGIHYSHSGVVLDYVSESQEVKIWLEESGLIIPEEQIFITPRIGVDYAGEDAFLPYRFFLKKIK
ncbi:MAG: DNA-3-methyladenine glycosylase [Bacteroidetes bacterium]|nr:DNA-3-methyladenine glycosylase [Bacteroidota bacterium]